MSLARNPNMMAYSMAGRQAQPRERLYVKENVYMPNAEVSDSYDGRQNYAAPEHIYRRKRTYDISVHSAALLIGVTFFIMMMLVISALVQKQAVVSTCNEIRQNMYKTQGEIDEVMVDIVKARDSATICYAAAQRLGMVASQGVTAIEINAPDTRPSADLSLPTGVIIASIGY